jgi:hypothetical protein
MISQHLGRDTKPKVIMTFYIFILVLFSMGTESADISTGFKDTMFFLKSAYGGFRGEFILIALMAKFKNRLINNRCFGDFVPFQQFYITML